MDMRKDAQMIVFRRFSAALLSLAAAATLLAGCDRPAPAVQPLLAPYPSPRSIVIAPLFNQSPSDQFDTLATTDVLVAEMSQVEGLGVLPTNRALKILVANRRTHVTSVEEAIQLAQLLGADGVVVGAVTEFNPYKPQKVGMTLQLYWVRADIDSGGLDPNDLARRPSEARNQGELAYYSGVRPAAQVQGVFDASRNDVTAQVQAYASGRQGQDSPFGWRKYLVDSDSYMHFVCHEMVVRLMNQEFCRITVPVTTQP